MIKHNEYCIPLIESVELVPLIDVFWLTSSSERLAPLHPPLTTTLPACPTKYAVLPYPEKMDAHIEVMKGEMILSSLVIIHTEKPP